MLYLSRRVDFSAMHSYRVSDWSEEKNRAVFGLCSNPSGHGHDYQLEVMVKGDLVQKSGIVVNTTDIKRIVGGFVQRELDGKFLNKELSYFQQNIPTTENLVLYLWKSIAPQLEDCELHRLRLHENPFLFSEKGEGNMVSLTRKYHFSAAHRLHSDQLTEEENIHLFGKCNNAYGHGHNYYLEVSVKGEPDPISGMVINISSLDETVESVVLYKFDHKHFNLDTEEFVALNPTSENVTKVMYDLLKPYIPNLYKIGLWETEKNYFEYMG
ncbi:6-carboxytetrahydropterin synthase [Terrihalobacillus insolitus]|uniref:6-carboxytetrahydropterin synthase n=1 Tax=Terrihalobacillus insolitus TaxID=2950438 RepID=UPI002340CA32|nr:6-carboxytetrahydropterin synthase [Terrihalobacillus insolitus]MDC3414987.1 6-carboxytetrahydropterin synthase [Terrihalobacillus insolitus]